MYTSLPSMCRNIPKIDLQFLEISLRGGASPPPEPRSDISKNCRSILGIFLHIRGQRCIHVIYTLLWRVHIRTFTGLIMSTNRRHRVFFMERTVICSYLLHSECTQWQGFASVRLTLQVLTAYISLCMKQLQWIGILGHVRCWYYFVSVIY